MSHFEIQIQTKFQTNDVESSITPVLYLTCLFSIPKVNRKHTYIKHTITRTQRIKAKDRGGRIIHFYKKVEKYHASTVNRCTIRENSYHTRAGAKIRVRSVCRNFVVKNPGYDFSHENLFRSFSWEVAKSSTTEASNYTEMFLWTPNSKVKLAQNFSPMLPSITLMYIEYGCELRLKIWWKITIYMVTTKLSQLNLFHICTLFDTSKLIIPCFSFRNVNLYILWCELLLETFQFRAQNKNT